jgi:hypothetical protein
MAIGAHVLSALDVDEPLKEILGVSHFISQANAAAPIAFFLGEEFSAPVDPDLLLPATGAGSQSAGLIVPGAYAESQLRRHRRTSFAGQVRSPATCPAPLAGVGAHP